jgi:putative transposase
VASRYPVVKVCQVLGVSRSGLYARRKRCPSARRQRDEELKLQIRLTFIRYRRTYGSPRIMNALRREGEWVGKNRVARLMREEGLRARSKRRYRPCTTLSNPRLAAAPNLLAEIPKPGAPDQVWVSDITYLPTEEGWHYLAVIMDLFSRRVVGWSTASTLETALVTKALKQAIRLRGRAPGLIHHSDRGCQYASHQYRAALGAAGITASMSRTGNCYDNATMESFFATLKTEGWGDNIAASRRHAELTVFDYIETFYNTKRLHSSLGYRSPREYEALHQATNQEHNIYALTPTRSSTPNTNQPEKRNRALQECNPPGISGCGGQPPARELGNSAGSLLKQQVGAANA